MNGTRRCLPVAARTSSRPSTRRPTATLAYWVGFQRSQANMRGQDQPVPFDLRVTEVYRRENGQWKLVHRHADPLKQSPAA